MGRVKQATRNITFGYLGNIVTGLLDFVLRTIFIRYLGDTLNGVNDLYTSLLTVLSMAELGIGTALNFSLYAPVARKDYEKIKSYMRLYRKAYLTIGCIIAIVGLLISPFLPYLVKVKDASIPLRDLTIYYFIFLFNTVSTYFVAYKYSLVNAEQKNYIQTNIITITKLITVAVQIPIIFLTQNFYWYLLSAAVIGLIQKIFVSRYLDHLYPYLKEIKGRGQHQTARLSPEETSTVIVKTKALLFHKIGDAARLQTDSIIISAFINVTLVGVVENYNKVILFVSNFANIIFNSVMSGFGNLIAVESRERQYYLFRVYRFFACWVYGFSAVGFYILLSPLIELWQGQDKVLEMSIIGWILIDYYFKGDRIVLSNFKTAAGVFEQDRFLPLIQGAVNLIISIGLVHTMGLAGIFVGTVLSGLIANIVRPLIIYRTCFDRKAGSYFADLLKYLVVMVVTLLLCHLVRQRLMPEVTYVTFGLTAIAVTIIFNAIFIALFYKSEEMKYVWQLINSKIKKR
jgi:O-antigen/teichoic acid export membrane protein